MITKHMDSDLARWLTGDSRLWERRGLRSMNTRREREDYCDLLLVGMDQEQIMKLWASVNFAVISPNFPYLRELEQFSARETVAFLRLSLLPENKKETKKCQHN